MLDFTYVQSKKTAYEYMRAHMLHEGMAIDESGGRTWSPWGLFWWQSGELIHAWLKANANGVRHEYMFDDGSMYKSLEAEDLSNALRVKQRFQDDFHAWHVTVTEFTESIEAPAKEPEIV